MLYISHRGNCNGLNPERENTQDYIDETIKRGYDVEIDIWGINNEYWLGHDEPEYKTTRDWMYQRKDRLWIHCKNFEALSNLVRQPSFRVFYHEKEKYTIISNGLIWAHDLSEINSKCIVPLLSKEDIFTHIKNVDSCYGICSDYVDILRVKDKI